MKERRSTYMFYLCIEAESCSYSDFQLFQLTWRSNFWLCHVDVLSAIITWLPWFIDSCLVRSEGEVILSTRKSCFEGNEAIVSLVSLCCSRQLSKRHIKLPIIGILLFVHVLCIGNARDWRCVHSQDDGQRDELFNDKARTYRMLRWMSMCENIR